MSAGDEPVGSVADEAAKLWSALTGGTPSAETGSDAFSELARTVGGWVRSLDDHLANGEACDVCPVCRGIRLVRDTSPELREQVGTAATAAYGLLSQWLAPPAAPTNEAPRDEEET